MIDLANQVKSAKSIEKADGLISRTIQSIKGRILVLFADFCLEFSSNLFKVCDLLRSLLPTGRMQTAVVGELNNIKQFTIGMETLYDYFLKVSKNLKNWAFLSESSLSSSDYELYSGRYNSYRNKILELASEIETDEINSMHTETKRRKLLRVTKPRRSTHAFVGLF